MTGHRHFIPIWFLFFLAMDATAYEQTTKEARWDRFYVGGHINYVHLDSDVTTESPRGPYFKITDYQQLSDAGSGSLSKHYSRGGLNAGWDKQWQSWVMGLEIDYLDAHDKTVLNSGSIKYLTVPESLFNTTSTLTTNRFISLRPRMGRLYNDALIYVTAGVAWVNTDYQFNFNDTYGGSYAASAQKTNTNRGLILGFGVEYALNDDWSIKAEYLHTTLDDVKTSSVVSNEPDQIIHNKVTVRFSNVRIGLNRSF
ncbi:hypothetical protein ACH42_05535 [Endozoicomonas sp. (ex Bugula neritina AB1)]|nr:hypothetical protein ACH42_05535 [Endozoicomonas sp. (ex Bugula neritina AB1)]